MNPDRLPDYAHEIFAKIARENGFNNFSVEINPGSQPGDGFTSELFSIKISENKSTELLELVCKIAPANANRRREFSSDNLFKNEALFYQTLMPILTKFQEEKQLSRGDQFQSYPKCYGAIIDDENER